MVHELDFEIQRNKLRLKRYNIFNWKVYFLKTFAFLLFLDVLIFLFVPQNLPASTLLTELALSLWAILMVCSIFTPIIGYWYRWRRKQVLARLILLKDKKKLTNEHNEKKI